MVPEAPVLFSTTMFWPTFSDIIVAATRAGTSVNPPAGNGTITLIGRVG
jgi:hypothetical protein